MTSQGMRNLESAARFTGRTTEKAAGAVEKAAVGLFRWMTTDHIGKGRAFQNMPQTGFADTIAYIITEIIIFGIIGPVLTGAIAYLLIAYGIPLLFSLLFYS